MTRTVLSDHPYDALIVGAGINGAVSAAALSARGLKVLIVDQADIASGTSQQSSNLVWGGIKYLQSYEFWLVFKLCLARARLMRQYPNRIRRIGFVASLGPNAPFGPLMATLGTLLYWAIGLFTTPAPRTFRLKRALELEPRLSRDRLRGAVRYFDGILPDNDSRFVWDFVNSAISLGANARNYTKLVSAKRIDEVWVATLEDALTGESISVSAKALVNAAGPWAQDILDSANASAKAGLVFSKGIHLVVPKLSEDDRVLAFWDEQNRLFYVIPMGDRSVIGTTDTRVSAPTSDVTDEDREFVLRQINASMNLEVPLTKDSIISERSGVRPLVVEAEKPGDDVDWHKLSRKHVVELDASNGLVTIFGGKLTDCLNVGAEVVTAFKKLGFLLKREQKWFGESVAEISPELLARVTAVASSGDSASSQRIASGLWRRHGAKAFSIVDARSADLAEVFEGTGVCYAELDYIIVNEMVVKAEDLLRRRLPLAMLRTEAEIRSNQKLQGLLAKHGLV